MVAECQVPDCGRPIIARNFCTLHYQRDKKAKPLNAPLRGTKLYLMARTRETNKGCLEWTGQVNKFGYGATTHRKKTVSTHRKSWIMTFGEIPDGLCVLHRCDNPPCINPSHLFLGTHLDNARDRDAKGRNGGVKIASRTTHCRNGHEYTKENTLTSEGVKRCRICARAKVARYKKRKAGLQVQW